MNTPNRKKLTGWLMLLIALLAFQLMRAGEAVKTIADTYQPHYAQFSSLATAVLLCQSFIAVSAAAWGYLALVLYRRKPGTLPQARLIFLTGAAFRLLGFLTIPLLGGFSHEDTMGMLHQILQRLILGAILTAVWYAYLIRSEKVRDIYTAS